MHCTECCQTSLGTPSAAAGKVEMIDNCMRFWMRSIGFHEQASSDTERLLPA